MRDQINEPIAGDGLHDIDAEKSVLSSIFFTPDIWDTVASKLHPDDFFSSANRQVYEAMDALASEGTVLSLRAVAEHLVAQGKLEAVGGLAYLTELKNFEGSSAAVKYTVQTVKKRALKRKILEAAQSMVKGAASPRTDADELLADAEAKLEALVQDQPNEAATDLKEIIAVVFADIRKRLDEGAGPPGIPTGFLDLDEKLSGLQKGALIILAARPAMGKTALALNIAANAALEGASVAFFSLEMTKDELGLRLLSSEAELNGKQLRDAQISTTEMGQFVAAVKKLSGAPLVVDDTPAIAIGELRNRARRLHKEGKCDLIMVDYLQLVRGSGGRASDNREQEIAEISRSFKALAKELNIPVLALSQLNRSLEQRKDKRPMLSDLRESGAIEQDADVIVFIYRDEYYEKESKDKGLAEIIIGKHRSGPTGTVKVAFRADYARFDNWTQQLEGAFP